MANPWDVKLISQLTENEMLGYVDHLESNDTLTRYADVDSLVERAVSYWHQTRQAYNVGAFPAHPFRAVVTTPLVRLTAATASSAVVAAYNEISITVYPWMDEKHVRYIAREQIMEQIGEHD